MTQFPKQLINLIGALVVIAALAAGVLLIGLPTYLGSMRIAADADRVATDNTIFRAQADALLAERSSSSRVAAEVSALREQIPATPLHDDIFELVVEAALANGVTVVRVAAEEPAAFTPQTGPLSATEDGSVTTAEAPPTAATESESQEDAAAGDTGSGETAAAPADPEVPVAASQQAIPFVIEVESPTVASTTGFLDALKKGPRLLAIVHALQETEEGQPSRLTVNALSFLRTES